MDLLEEPHHLGAGGNDGRNFSPHSMMVRNPPVSTPAGSVVSAITDNTDQVAREGLMLRTYSDNSTSYILTSHDKTNIKDVSKKHLVTKVKFILSDRVYPSFWQPDLLNNTPPYVDAFFAAYGNKYKDRKTNDTILVEAVRLWKAAAPKLKKDVDNHRAALAQKMKADIMAGEDFVLQ